MGRSPPAAARPAARRAGGQPAQPGDQSGRSDPRRRLPGLHDPPVGCGATPATWAAAHQPER
ncbi:MAG TPA: hypothetical protein VNL71_20130 [Chloroflexota bacterium]|nr:hypothetical protein [Chloroflexota bacterium]